MSASARRVLMPFLAAWLPGLLAPALCHAAQDAEPAPRPNIVFILIDDIGRTDVGFMGSKDMGTPAIDALAESGAVLDAHYVQPVCSPTRAALMTGRYATGTGVYTIVRPHAKWGLPLQERTLATALREAGYETAIAGKWHLGEFEPAYLPTARGFDHQYGHYFGAIDYFTHERDGMPDWHRDDKDLKEEGYSTQLIANEACRLIREKDKNRPLFLYVPFNGVHTPLEVPESYTQPYGDLSEPRRKLAGMIAAVDEAVGRIVSALDEARLRDDTLIVVVSDNGGPNPGVLSTNGEYRAGKGTIYEGGVRVCACVNWPHHIRPGQYIREPIHAVDWFPTLVKLAGGSLEQKLPLDGRDIWPVLSRAGKSPHEAILLVQSPTHAAVRMGDWKLIVTKADGDGAGDASAEQAKPRRKQAAAPAIELYSLGADPGETTNMAEDEPERVALMMAKLESLLKDAAKPGHIGFQDETPKRKKAAARRKSDER